MTNKEHEKGLGRQRTKGHPLQQLLSSLKEGEFGGRYPIPIVLLRKCCKHSLSEERVNPTRQEQHKISRLAWWL